MWVFIFSKLIFAIVLGKNDRLARSKNNNFIAFDVKQRHRSLNLKSVRCFNVEVLLFLLVPTIPHD